MEPRKYPRFDEAERYMKCRASRTPLGLLKGRAERAALERCLAGLEGVGTVLDVPSGPGRLFSFWAGRGLRVDAVDVSDRMVRAAREAHQRLGLRGEVREGDVFHLEGGLAEQADLAACVRFAYYFDRPRRVGLLRSLASVSRRYVLVQYKTTETLKGCQNLVRRSTRRASGKEHLTWHFCSHQEIQEELREAGLMPLRIEPVGELSDRVFVLAEKRRPEVGAEESEAPCEIRVRRPWRGRLVGAVFLLFALIYCLNSADRSFWGENEAYYALGARSVLAGDWLAPRINHDLLADKPPLVFWWVALVSAPFGEVTEWSGRLANVLAGLGVLGALFWVARRGLNTWSALLAVIVLGSAYEFWENVTEINTDMVLLALLTASWGALLGLLERPFRLAAWIVLWGGLGLAVLAKGPVALLLTAGITAAYAVLRYGVRGAWASLGRLRPLWGGVLALGPFALWAGLVYAKLGSGPLRVILLKHNVERFVSAFDHRQPWWYLIRELPVNFLPWSLLLPFAVWHVVKLWRGGARGWRALALPGGGATQSDAFDPEDMRRAVVLFACCAVGVVLGFFSVSSSKRDYYLLPLMPWGALLMGDLLWSWLSARSPVAMAAPCDERGFGALVLGLARGRLLLGVTVLVVSGMALYAGVVTGFLDARKSARPLARSVERVVSAGERLILLDIADPRIMFYLRRSFDLVDDSEAGLEYVRRAVSGPGRVCLLVHAGDIEDVARMQTPPLFVKTTALFRDHLYYVLTNEAGPELAALSVIPVRGLSGLCYHAGRNSVYAVGNKGMVAELDLRGQVLNQREVGGDLEAVTVNPGGNALVVADEDGGRILELDAATLELQRAYRLEQPPSARPRIRDWSRGIEGLSFLSDGGGSGRLLAVKEDKPALLMELHLEEGAGSGEGRAVVAWARPLRQGGLVEITSPGRGETLLVFSGRSRRLFEVSAAGETGRSWRLPDLVQKEAMAWLPDGRLLVCGADAVPHTMPNPGVLGTSGVGRQSVLRFLPSGGKKVLP